MTRAVFLDRDGTLIEEIGYLERLDRIDFFPFTIDAVRLLNRAGFAVIVVSNQAGIARGIVEESFVAAAHHYISERLARGGARVDAYYYCPHHPDGIVDRYRQHCECRKPRPGLFRRAAAESGVDLTRSFVIGDCWHDLQAGEAVGARGLLVRTGHGQSQEASSPPIDSAVVVDNLIAAVSWILRQP